MASCGNKSGAKVALKTSNDSFSYAFGALIGSKFLKDNNIKDINWEVFKAAVEKSLVSGDSGLALNQETMQKVLGSYVAESKYGENKKKGQEYIDKNLKNGFTKTSSGLLYKKVKDGNGLKGNITDTILVFYTGKYVDGNTFDSNVGGKPAKFALNGGAIPGFIEALTLMDEGSEYEVIIPYNLAYGSSGRQNPYTGASDIEPYQTLCFNIKSVGIQK